VSCDLLSGCALDSLREVAAELLPDTATIYRRTLSADGRGGKVATYAAQIETIPCRLTFPGEGDKPTIVDREVGGRIRPQQQFLVTMPTDADVLETDRLGINGTTFDIISSLATRSFQVVKRLLVVPV
jgi:hypothetical protein